MMEERADVSLREEAGGWGQRTAQLAGRPGWALTLGPAPPALHHRGQQLGNGDNISLLPGLLA